MQAAIGCAQLEKFEEFVLLQKKNWTRLLNGLKNLSSYFEFCEPTPNSEPSWFGFAMRVLPHAPFTRSQLVQFLESQGVQTRMLFSGNILAHPCFSNLSENDYRVVGDLTHTMNIMDQTMWVGVYPELNESELDHIIHCFQNFISDRKTNALV